MRSAIGGLTCFVEALTLIIEALTLIVEALTLIIEALTKVAVLGCLGYAVSLRNPERFGPPDLDGLQSRNLFEVGLASGMLPKVAEYSNLGLRDAILVGIACLYVQTRLIILRL